MVASSGCSLWLIAVCCCHIATATSAPHGAVPSTEDLDLQNGCTSRVMLNFTDAQGGDDRHDLDTIRVGMALNWGNLSADSQSHIRNTLIFWKEWTTPGSFVSSIMFGMSTNEHVELPLWRDGRPVETIFCVLDDFGDVERAKAIYKEFTVASNQFHVLLGGMDARINMEVVKVVNNSEVLTFLWAFHRRGLYDNGVGILPSGVVEPSARSVIDFDNTTEESRVGAYPIIDGARWPNNFRELNLRGVFDLNVQPKDMLAGPLALLRSAGARSLRAFASPDYLEACLEAVSNSGLEFLGIVNIVDFTHVPRALKIIDTSTVLVLCSHDFDLHNIVISSVSTGFAPFAVLFHDTQLVDLALDDFLLPAVSYFTEPYPLPPCEWLDGFTIEDAGLSSFTFLTAVYALRFLEDEKEGIISAFGFQLLAVAELILAAARTLGYVDNYAALEDFLLSPEPRDTWLGPLRFASSGLRDVALTSTRQAFPVLDDAVPLLNRGSVMLTPPVIMDPSILSEDWAHRLRIWVNSDPRFRPLGSVPWALRAPMPDFTARYLETYPCILGEQWSGTECLPCAPGRHRSAYDKECRYCLLGGHYYANEPGRAECKICPALGADCDTGAPWQTPVARAGHHRLIKTDWHNTNLSAVKDMLAIKAAWLEEEVPLYNFFRDDPVTIWAYIHDLPPQTVVNLLNDESFNWTSVVAFPRCKPEYLCLGANICEENHVGVLCSSCIPGTSRRLLYTIINEGLCVECTSVPVAYAQVIFVWLAMILFSRAFAEIGRRTAQYHASISVAVMRIVIMHFACTGLARGTILSAGITSAPDGISVLLNVIVAFVTDPYGTAGADCLREAQTPAEAIAQNLILQDIFFIGGLFAIGFVYHIRQARHRIQKHARKAQKKGVKAAKNALSLDENVAREGKEDRRDKVRKKYETIMLSNKIARNRRVNVNHSIAWLFVAMPSFLLAHLDAETCTPEFDGDERLLTKPAILCGSDEYRYVRRYAQVVTVVNLICVPAGVAYVWWLHRELTCDITTTLQWGTLFSGYRSDGKLYAMLYIAKFYFLAMSRFTSSLPLRVMLSFTTVAVVGMIEYLVEPFQPFDYYALHKLELCSNVLLLLSILVVGLETLAAEPGADSLIIYLSRQIGDTSDQFLSISTFLFVLLGAWCMIYNNLFVSLAITRDSKLDAQNADWRKRPWYTRLTCMLGLLPPPQAMNTMVAQVKHAGIRKHSHDVSSTFQISYIDSAHLNPFEVGFWLNGLENLLDEVLRRKHVFSIGLLLTLVDEAYERAVHGRTAFMEVLKHKGHFWMRKTRMELRRNTLDLLTVEGLPSMSSTGSLHGAGSGNVPQDEQGSCGSDASGPAGMMKKTDDQRIEARQHVNFAMTVVELCRAMVDLQADIILGEPSLQRKLGIRSQGVRTVAEKKPRGYLDLHKSERLERHPGVTLQITLIGLDSVALLDRPHLVKSLESSFGFSMARELPEVVNPHCVNIVGLRKDQGSNTVVTVIVTVRHEAEAPELLRRMEDHTRNNLLQPILLLHLPIDVVKLSSQKLRAGLVTVTQNTTTEVDDDVQMICEGTDASKEAEDERTMEYGKSRQFVEEAIRRKENLDTEGLIKELLYSKEMEMRALQNALKDAELLGLERLRTRRDLELRHAHSAAARPRNQQGELLDFCEIAMHFAAPHSKAPIAESFGQDAFRLQFRTALRRELTNILVKPPNPDLDIHLGLDEPTARVRGSESDLTRLRAALDSSCSAGVRNLMIMGYTLDKAIEQLATGDPPRSPKRSAAPSPPSVPGPLLPKPKRKSAKASQEQQQSTLANLESGARLPLAVATPRVVQQEQKHPQQTQLPQQNELPRQTEQSLQQRPRPDHWRDLLRNGRIFDADRRLRQTDFSDVEGQVQIADVRVLYEASLAMLAESNGWHLLRDGHTSFRSHVANGVLMLCCIAELHEFNGDALRAFTLMLEADMRPLRSKRMAATELVQPNCTPEHALWRMLNQRQKASYLRCSAVDALDESSQSLWVFDRTMSEEDAVLQNDGSRAVCSPIPQRGAWGAYRIAPLQEEGTATTTNRVRGLRFTFLSEAPVSKEVEKAASENPETLRTAMFRDSQRFLEAFRCDLKQRRDELDVRILKSRRAQLYSELRHRLRGYENTVDEEESENIVSWLD